MSFRDYRRRLPGRSAVAIVFWWIGVRSLCRVLMRLLYRQRCLDREHVPPRGPAIYVANHQSHLDPVIIGCLVGPFSSLARASLFRFRPFGLMIRAIGAIPLHLDRNPARAFRSALRELEAGGRVLIFPEGSRTEDGAIQRFRPGMLVLLRRSGAPVVPVAVEGAFDVWRRGRRFPRLTGRVAVKAGPALPAEALLSGNGRTAPEQLRRTIETMRLELRRELRRRSRGRYPAPGLADEPYWHGEADATR